MYVHPRPLAVVRSVVEKYIFDKYIQNIFIKNIFLHYTEYPTGGRVLVALRYSGCEL